MDDEHHVVLIEQKYDLDEPPGCCRPPHEELIIVAVLRVGIGGSLDNALALLGRDAVFGHFVDVPLDPSELHAASSNIIYI